MAELRLAVVLAVGVLFVDAGVAKYRLGRFRTEITEYQIIPTRLVPAVSTVLPAVEIALGLALLIGLGTDPALVILAVLLVAFSVGMAVNLLRGRRISCGCRGSAHSISWPLASANVVLAVAAGGTAALGASPGLRALLSASPGLSRGNALATLISLVLVGVATRVVALGSRLRRRMDTFSAPHLSGGMT